MNAQPDPLVTVLAAGSVVVSPQAAWRLLRESDIAETVRRRNGVAQPADLVEIRAGLEVAAATAHSFASFVNETTKQGFASDLSSSLVGTSDSFSTVVLVDPVGVAEASRLARCSEQWIRVRCRRGEFASARRQGRTWLIERAELLARIQDEAA